MVNKIVMFTVCLFLFSCAQQENFPTPLSQKADVNAVEITLAKESTYNSEAIGKIAELKGLQEMIGKYHQREESFNLGETAMTWKAVHTDLDLESIHNSELNEWFDVTGLLFELSGEVFYATELEKLAFTGGIENDKIASYVFTKNMDHLFTNIYTPGVIQYDHSLGGKVSVELVTEYPKSGKVDLKFKMTERRYMEINIRIPEWADGTLVTVKGVKYFTAPGSYCKIAKKWKEDDLVEIEFPIEKKPGFLQ